MIQTNKPTDPLNLHLIQASLVDLKKPNAKIFWTDLVITCAMAYTGFWIAIDSRLGTEARLAGFVLSTLAFYRAIYFNHECFHSSGGLKYFSLAYNLLVGFFVKFPTYIYEPHQYHHTRSEYGTLYDSEYANMRGKIYPLLVLPFIIAALTPITLFFRFFILPPLMVLMSEKFRQKIFVHLSTFALLPTYRRPLPELDEKIRWYRQDLGCFLYWLGFLALIHFEVWTVQALWIWGAMAGAIFVFNHFRAIVAHTYDTKYRSSDFVGQIETTMTIETGFLGEIWAPMSISYHTLHHLMPKVPYHNLKKAHRILLGVLPADHPYRKGLHKSYFSALKFILSKPQ